MGWEFAGANEPFLIFFADAWSFVKAVIFFHKLDFGFFSLSSGQGEPVAHGPH